MADKPLDPMYALLIIRGAIKATPKQRDKAIKQIFPGLITEMKKTVSGIFLEDIPDEN